MSREFISKEVSKVVKEEGFEYPQNMAMAAAWVLGNFKGVNLKVLKTDSTSSLADYYVLGSASNFTQARAMADEVVFQLKEHGLETISKEGFKTGADWILIDLGDIIVHVFLESSRSVYNMEDVWKQATEIEIPQHYYFSSEDEEKANEDKGFF